MIKVFMDYSNVKFVIDSTLPVSSMTNSHIGLVHEHKDIAKPIERNIRVRTPNQLSSNKYIFMRRNLNWDGGSVTGGDKSISQSFFGKERYFRSVTEYNGVPIKYGTL